MADGSIAAAFDFLSYKIDKIEMNMGDKIGYLMKDTPVLPDDINLSIKLRSTEKFVLEDGSSNYIGGLNTQIELIDNETQEIMLKGEFGISGVFIAKDPVKREAEENFAKINLPAILMPYLRASMTNILSCAGFGTILFPLINIYELAKIQNLQIIDHSVKNKIEATN
jgi:preprotein translocase subunit SecB